MSTLRRATSFSPADELANVRVMLSLFDARAWGIVLLGAAGISFAIALMTAMFENPIFGRMEPTRPQDFVILAATALLGGLILGSYALRTNGGDEGKLMTGGFLSYVAVGCPVCNKVAVAALGTSGALSVFGPAQLYIGLLSLALLGWTLLLRARSVAGSCPTA